MSKPGGSDREEPRSTLKHHDRVAFLPLLEPHRVLELRCALRQRFCEGDRFETGYGIRKRELQRHKHSSIGAGKQPDSVPTHAHHISGHSRDSALNHREEMLRIQHSCASACIKRGHPTFIASSHVVSLTTSVLHLETSNEPSISVQCHSTSFAESTS